MLKILKELINFKLQGKIVKSEEFEINLRTLVNLEN